MHTFTDEQLHTLTHLIIDEFGVHLSDDQFNEICGMLFEDIAGLETTSDEDRQSLTDTLRNIYHDATRKTQ